MSKPRRGRWPYRWREVFAGPAAWPGLGNALPIRAQNAVAAGLRRQILALTGQFRQGGRLAGRLAGALRGIAIAWNGGAFICAELVVRRWPVDHRPLVRANLAALRPSAQGPITDAQLGAGFGSACTSADGLFDQNNGGLAIWGADPASSSPPWITDAFFLRTRSAATRNVSTTLRHLGFEFRLGLAPFALAG